jgi:hypothetical protein
MDDLLLEIRSIGEFDKKEFTKTQASKAPELFHVRFNEIHMSKHVFVL